MTILEMSVQGTAAVLLVLLFRAIAFHRAPKRVFPALWGLVCLCLLCPLRLEVELPAPAAGPGAASSPVTAPAGPLDAAAALAEEPVPLPAEPSALPGGREAAELLPALWAVGAAGVGGWFLTTHLYYRRKYRDAAGVEDGPVRDFLAAHPLGRRVTVKRTAQVASPLTYGLFRPVILLPRNFPAEGEELAFVLAHELAHIKRWDVARKWLLALAVSVHWFNPVVWLMYALANRDMELACDEAVTHSMKRQEKAAYLMSLLDLAERRSGIAPLGTGFGKNAVKERVMAVMKAKKITMWGKAAAAAAVVLVAAVGLLTVGVAAEAPPAEPAPAQSPAPVSTPVQAAPAPTGPLPAGPSAPPESGDPPDFTTDVRTHPITGEQLYRWQAEQQEALHIPTEEWILEHGYPTNDLGETYGPCVKELGTPDLELALNRQGLQGYVRQSEVPGSNVSTPEEAMEYMESRAPEGTWINLYLQDGVTVIGKFLIKGP